jgi:hypothetical protein
MTSPSPDLDVGPLLRKLAPRVLGAVIRRFRDFAACEDAVQEALIAAAMQWSAGWSASQSDEWSITFAPKLPAGSATLPSQRTPASPSLPRRMANPRSIPTIRSSCCSYVAILRSRRRPRSR